MRLSAALALAVAAAGAPASPPYSQEPGRPTYAGSAASRISGAGPALATSAPAEASEAYFTVVDVEDLSEMTPGEVAAHARMAHAPPAGMLVDRSLTTATYMRHFSLGMREVTVWIPYLSVRIDAVPETTVTRTDYVLAPPPQPSPVFRRPILSGTSPAESPPNMLGALPAQPLLPPGPTAPEVLLPPLMRK